MEKGVVTSVKPPDIRCRPVTPPAEQPDPTAKPKLVNPFASPEALAKLPVCDELEEKPSQLPKKVGNAAKVEGAFGNAARYGVLRNARNAIRPVGDGKLSFNAYGQHTRLPAGQAGAAVDKAAMVAAKGGSYNAVHKAAESSLKISARTWWQPGSKVIADAIDTGLTQKATSRLVVLVRAQRVGQVVLRAAPYANAGAAAIDAYVLTRVEADAGASSLKKWLARGTLALSSSAAAVGLAPGIGWLPSAALGLASLAAGVLRDRFD